MRTISYKLEDLKKVVINLGYEGENEHTRVRIDAGEVFASYPDAVATLTVQPPKGSAYPVVVVRDGNVIEWTVQNSNLTSKGNGELQFTFTENNKVIKSCVAKLSISRSLHGQGQAPDPVQDWIDDAEEVLDDLAAMDNIAKTAEAGDIGKALSPKTVENGVVTEWQYVEPGAGTEDYTDLENKPQIGGVTLSGDKSLHDLGIAAESAIPDVSGKANLSVVAPAFDQATANDAGSLVTFTDGVVYVLPEGHTAGTTWANTQKTATNIAEQQRALLNAIQGKYTLPSGGIPDTDLSSGVQSSLGKADSAYQKPQTGIPASDLADDVLKNWELIAEYTVPTDAASVEITTDTNGQSFELESMYVRAALEEPTTANNDYVSSNVIYKDNNDVIRTQQTTSLRYNSGTAKIYLDIFVKLIYRFWVMFAKAGVAFSNSQNAQMSSFYNYDSSMTVKTICGFKLSQYNSTSTLIPQGTNIKIYGIRK